MLLRGPPLSPGVVRGVGTTSRDPLPRAPLSVGASAAEWEILDGKRVDLQSGAPGQARPARFAGPGLPLPGRSAQISRSRSEAGPARRKPGRQTVLPGPVCGT